MLPACFLTYLIFILYDTAPDSLLFDLLDADKYSWSENYAGSSGLQSPLPGHRLPSLPVAVSVDQLEMDRIDQGVLVYCPLLDQPASYVPDMVDLTEDAEARYIFYLCDLINNIWLLI